MGNFVSLSTALTAIRAGQVGLDATTNNVANANTPGYTRQRVELTERPAYGSPTGPMGSGVDVARVARLRDAFLDARLRTTTADASYHDVEADLLARAETVTGEPDAGVTGALDDLWNAFEDLSNDPSNPATRQQVMSALQSLTGRFTSISRGWSLLEGDTQTRQDAIVSEVNGLAAQVAKINDQVQRAAGGVVPNNVYDARDVAIDRLAELTGVVATAGGSIDANGVFQPDGTVTLSVAGHVLVRGDTAGSIAADAGSPTGLSMTDADSPIAAPLAMPSAGGPKGELGAVMTFLQDDLPGMQDDLDQLAVAVKDALNTQHHAGYVQDGTTATAGGDLLQGTGAGDLALVAGFTGADLAASGSAQPGEIHDGANAAALAALRISPSGPSLNDQARTLVTSIGGAVQNARRQTVAADQLRDAAANARESAHGVSIDEEMVQMVRYQRSLEAASRVMTAVDEALDVLVNRTGVVGR